MKEGVGMFMHPYCKYSDGTEVVFSDIIINENGEETIQIHFGRPTLEGFDSIRYYTEKVNILMKKLIYLKRLLSVVHHLFIDGHVKGKLILPSIFEFFRIQNIFLVKRK